MAAEYHRLTQTTVGHSVPDTSEMPPYPRRCRSSSGVLDRPSTLTRPRFPSSAGASLLAAAALPVLASCALVSPSTSISIQVAKPDGETISAQYHSTKDIAAPSFAFERNPDTGQVESIHVTAEGTSASGVIQSQSDAIANLADAIAEARP
jgi:hypothetical protein